MKIAKKKVAFVLSVFLVSLLALGYRTMSHVIGLRNSAKVSHRHSADSCGIPIANADVPFVGGEGGAGNGGGGCEGEGGGGGGGGCG